MTTTRVCLPFFSLNTFFCADTLFSSALCAITVAPAVAVRNLKKDLLDKCAIVHIPLDN
jgi:hypothetical protein